THDSEHPPHPIARSLGEDESASEGERQHADRPHPIAPVRRRRDHHLQSDGSGGNQSPKKVEERQPRPTGTGSHPCTPGPGRLARVSVPPPLSASAGTRPVRTNRT